MPVDAENFRLFSEESPSTYPQNIAYKAAQMSSTNNADLFLYNMRTVAAAEARRISHEDVLLSTASESGLDIEKFLTHLHDGSAERAFNGDRNLMAGIGVSGFPAFLIKFNSSQYMLRGYNRYETFAAVINSASHGSVRAVKITVTENSVLDFMDKHPRMAAEEFRQAFDFEQIADAEKFLEPMIASGKVETYRAGNGWFIRKLSQHTGCDFATGVCS